MIARRLLVIALLCLTLPALAQDDPPTTPALPYDPADLALRYTGATVEPALPELVPLPQIGDTATFLIGQTGSTAPTPVEAALVARTSQVTIWQEVGLTAEPGDLRAFASGLGRYLTALTTLANFAPPVTVLDVANAPDSAARLSLPDVDNDSRLTIVYTTRLSDDRDAIVNPLDSQPLVIAPLSAGHDLIAVNTTVYTDTPLADPLYRTMTGRALYRVVMQRHNPTAAPWLFEALNWRLLFSSLDTGVNIDDVYAWFAAPDTSLIRPAGLTNLNAVRGGGQLFLNYLNQRYSADLVRDLHLYAVGTDAVNPMAAIDAALAGRGAVDPTTGVPVTARDVFADFVIANAVNTAFGDGRYVHVGADFEVDRLATAQEVTLPTADEPTSSAGGTVLPYAARYYRITAARAVTLDVTFTASGDRPLLAMDADRDPADSFYWAGGGAGRNAQLTRALDLTGVAAGTPVALTFDAWHSLADGWNAGYVSVSTDGGARWTALPTNSTVDGSRYGTPYGPAFMGISNPEPPRPFPIIGVVVAGDGQTVQSLSPGGAADTAGVQAGDVIVGYEGEEWPGPPNLIALLVNYFPGDTLTLLVQRGRERLDVPVVLGAHPTRVFVPPPLWREQTVDLSAYAGSDILLRFESVALPLVGDAGFAVDNIAVEAVGFADPADGSIDGWTFAGWSVTDNREPTGWIAQVYTSGTETSPPRVRRLADRVVPAGAFRSDGGGAADAVNATLRIALLPGETAIVAVSAVDGVGDQAATFSLTFTRAGE